MLLKQKKSAKKQQHIPYNTNIMKIFTKLKITN